MGKIVAREQLRIPGNKVILRSGDSEEGEWRGQLSIIAFVPQPSLNATKLGQWLSSLVVWLHVWELVGEADDWDQN